MWPGRCVIDSRSPGLQAPQSKGTAVAELVFDPAEGGLEAAFASYRSLYAAGADTELTGRQFYAAVSAHAFPQAVLFDRTLADVRHVRSAARVRRDDFDHITVQYVRQGVMQLECDGVHRLLGPGEAALVEMTRPFTNHTRGRVVTASLGRDLLRSAGLTTGGLHGVVFAGDAGARLGAVVRSLLSGSEKPPAAGERLVEEIRDALAPGLRRAESREAERRERAMRYIEHHLDAAELTPADVARATGMSRATLFRAFEPFGGVSAWIQGRRLRRARHLLATTDMTVSQAGAVSGLPSASHLTAAFRARWNMTPSDYRKAQAALRDGPRAAAALRDIAAALA